MITCERCGKENQDHYKFCLGCGAELSAPPKGAGPGAGGGGGGSDVGMMKTMMADVGQGGLPSPPSGGGLPGVGPAPGGPAPGGPPPGGQAPGGPPPGGPPPSQPQNMAPTGPAPSAPAPGPVSQGWNTPGTSPGASPLGPPPPGPSTGMQPPAGPPPGVPAGTAGGPSAPPAAAGGPAPTGGPQRCPSCAAEVPAAFKFCGACGHRMESASAPAEAPQGRSTADFAQPTAQPGLTATLTLIRPDGSEGGTHQLQEGENTIGREHGQIFEQDGYLSPTHAELVVNAAGAVVRDLDSLNGVFVKMTEEEPVEPGQILRLGQELLRFDAIEPPEPTEDGTEVMGSPNPGYWGKITVIIGGDVDGSAFPLLGDSVTLGRERGDINFPDDGYVSGLHARLYTRDGRVYLTDLGSSNGTFIKVQGERQVGNNSFVLLGQQLFRLTISG
jgi:pSer/pThr/pTyr-binding forkhead associated (FHA) protein